MSDVDRLFDSYREEHRASGAADPRLYLEQVEGADRRELAALIHGYLDRAPGREWDPAAFEGSPEQRLTERIAAAWEEPAQEPEPAGWSELLPWLRERARIKRAELAAKLAEAIGHPDQTQKVAAYYHQMETGQLPSEGVSHTVLAALGEIVGESAERLRAAGSVLQHGGDEQEVMTKLAFARTAAHDPSYAGEAPAPGAAAPAPQAAEGAEPAAEARDAVDELFTGGADAA